MNDDRIDAYPLQWPEGWKRWEGQRDPGRFDGTPGTVRDMLLLEIDRLVLGRESRTRMVRRDLIVISTNMPLRRDGLPMSGRVAPEDPGVAVYFKRDGKPMCFACDKYDRVWKNMRAIQKTIEALRGIERWGSSDMMERAFTGFAALPAPGARPWWEVMGLNGSESKDAIRSRFRELARQRHPDSGGSDQLMAELNEAYKTAMDR